MIQHNYADCSTNILVIGYNELNNYNKKGLAYPSPMGGVVATHI